MPEALTGMGAGELALPTVHKGKVAVGLNIRVSIKRGSSVFAVRMSWSQHWKGRNTTWNDGVSSAWGTPIKHGVMRRTVLVLRPSGGLSLSGVAPGMLLALTKGQH